MRNNTKELKIVVWIAAAVCLFSLLAVCIFIGGTAKPLYVLVGYGIWNLCIFGIAWLVISRRVTDIMRQVDDCIQSMIDGQPVWNFPVGAESLLGKFQVQLMKLYQILSSSREREERQRKELSSLVADLIHQINTPLTNIQIYSGFLMQDDLVGEEKAQMCQIIDDQIEKLGWFADGFTKTARLEEDMRKLRPERQQILPMILSAIDEISVKAEAHGNEICLLGEQDIEALFNRYYRGKNASCMKEGVGLGLYLVRQIAAEQGGYVKVGDYKGKGTVFSLFLLKN